MAGSKRRWVGWLAGAGFAVCAVVILHLARQSDALAGRYETLRERLQWPHPGYAVPTFTATTLDGEPLTVGTAARGERQLLLVFDTECGYCRASLPAWKRIVEKVGARSFRVRVIGISLDSADKARPYRDRHSLPFPIVTFPEPKLAELYRAQRFPLIVLLDAEGRTLYSRLGLLESETAVDSVLEATEAKSQTTERDDRIDTQTSTRSSSRFWHLSLEEG